jgi:hypothetical protein
MLTVVRQGSNTWQRKEDLGTDRGSIAYAWYTWKEKVCKLAWGVVLDYPLAVSKELTSARTWVRPQGCLGREP